MTLRKIEGFELDGSPSIAKLNKKEYKRLLKSETILGSDDLNGAAEDNVSFVTGKQGNGLNITADYDTINVGCPSCSSQTVSFGSYLKIPIYDVPLDSFGVVGFAVKFNNLNHDLVAYGFQDDTDNDGQIFFALGGLHNDSVNVVVGVRASDSHVYLKVVTSSIDLYTSTSLTGTYGDKYRGFHNDSSSVIDTGFTVSTATWYNVEVKYKFSESSSGQVLLYINGTLVASTNSNLDFVTPLKNAAFLCSMHSLVTNDPVQTTFSTLSQDFDNFYHLDDTGNKNNDYIGNFNIRRVYATSDIVNEGYANNTPYVCIATDDDDTGYVAIQSGEREIYGFSSLTDINTRILGVEYTFLTKFGNNPLSRIFPIIDYSSVQYSGISLQIPVSGGGYFYHSITSENNLVNNGDWTLDQINNGNHGFTILS